MSPSEDFCLQSWSLNPSLWNASDFHSWLTWKVLNMDDLVSMFMWRTKNLWWPFRDPLTSYNQGHFTISQFDINTMEIREALYHSRGTPFMTYTIAHYSFTCKWLKIFCPISVLYFLYSFNKMPFYIIFYKINLV